MSLSRMCWLSIKHDDLIDYLMFSFDPSWTGNVSREKSRSTRMVSGTSRLSVRRRLVCELVLTHVLLYSLEDRYPFLQCETLVFPTMRPRDVGHPPRSSQSSHHDREEEGPCMFPSTSFLSNLSNVDNLTGCAILP